MKNPNTYSEVKRTHPRVDWDNTYMYRVRGISPYTGKDVWVTKTWRRTRDEAEFTARTLDDRWSNVRIIKKNVGEYMREMQNIPRFG